MENFSVLISLYYKEDVICLSQCLDSVFNQTLLPSEVIIVEDGPLTAELYDVINQYKEKYPAIKTIPLKENVGLGKALNEGLKYCTYNLVARMDTDDICKSTRFEKQILYMKQHPEIAVCGSWIEEFIDSPDNIVSVRKLPENHEDIYQYGKKRTPTNHVTVVFRKDLVMEVGSYQHCALMEDYYLWLRMIVKGMKFHNIPESLVYVRISEDMFKRRGGFKYACTEASFQCKMLKLGYINIIQAIKNISIRFTVRMMPNCMRGFIYKKLIRKRNK